MITSPLHLLNRITTIRTPLRSLLNNRLNRRLLNPQPSLIPIFVFLASETGMPGPVVDVAHFIVAGVANHELFAESVDLA
jgi:hypothetical protein